MKKPQAWQKHPSIGVMETVQCVLGKSSGAFPKGFQNILFW